MYQIINYEEFNEESSEESSKINSDPEPEETVDLVSDKNNNDKILDSESLEAEFS
ncbi:5291_t:CDS:2 [Scutellospora calospora]|uniref:5291_t:CDS:1 n=1 Tax=Scutellospora calospora TaxID=85575 RepID=A0ACA9K3I0_9GLOM|nr:5291_t:CDS:2 [Scutellospora calospora]